jgi:hypothetical protein
MALAAESKMADPRELSSTLLSWQLDSWKTLDFTARTGLDNLRAAPGRSPAFDALVEHYIEARTGGRYLEWRQYKQGKLVGREEHLTDGKRCWDVAYGEPDFARQNAVTIKHSFFMEGQSDQTDRPFPLRMLWIGRVPLDEAILKAEAVGEDRTLGRPCDTFLFRNVPGTPGQDWIYSLDRETAAPLRVASYANAEDRTADRPVWIWRAESLDPVAGRHFPLRSTMDSYRGGQHTFVRTFTVESIAYDQEHPATTFRPTIQPGVQVFDQTTNRGYVTPGKPVEAPSMPPAPGGGAGRPILAVAPSPWTAAAPTVGIGLGAALLLTALGIWWRRR